MVPSKRYGKDCEVAQWLNQLSVSELILYITVNSFAQDSIALIISDE